MTKMLAVVMTIGACSSSSNTPPPTCNQAVMRFYTAGCEFVDSNSNPIPVATSIDNCLAQAGAAPAQCIGDLDDFLDCINGQPLGSTSAECTTCSPEQMTFLQCR